MTKEYLLKNLIGSENGTRIMNEIVADETCGMYEIIDNIMNRTGIRLDGEQQTYVRDELYELSAVAFRLGIDFGLIVTGSEPLFDTLKEKEEFF